MTPMEKLTEPQVVILWDVMEVACEEFDEVAELAVRQDQRANENG